MKGIRQEDLKPAVQKKGALGNDRSTWGRPVGGKPSSPVAKGADQKSTIALKSTRPDQTLPNKRPPSGKPTNVPPPRGSKLPPPRRNPQPYYPRPYPPPGHKHPPQEGALVNPAKVATAPKPAPQAKAKTPAQEKGALSNDRSRWGRPVGTKTKPIASNAAKAPVQGITKENLKPANPERISARPKRDKLGNDRSTLGRPVGGKRHTLQSRRQGKQIIRGHRRDRKAGHIIRGRSSDRSAKRIVRDQRRDRKAQQINRSHRSKSMTRGDRRWNDRSGMGNYRKQTHSFRMQRNQDRHALNNNRDFGHRHRR